MGLTWCSTPTVTRSDPGWSARRLGRRWSVTLTVMPSVGSEMVGGTDGDAVGSEVVGDSDRV